MFHPVQDFCVHELKALVTYDGLATLIPLM